MSNIKKYMQLKTQEEKNDIERQLLSKTLSIEKFSLENLIDLISVAKTNLNNEIKDFTSISLDDFNNNLYTSVIKAKNKKIDKLILDYNQGIFNNKIKFENNKIIFDTIRQINKIKLEIDNFAYDIPIDFIIKINCYDGESIRQKIIPFNYNGLFSEYFNLNESNISNYEINNKNNIYFYTCHYNNQIFKLGNEIQLKEEIDYGFEDNKLYFNNDLQYRELLIKYIPSYKNYELDINKKVKSIELLPINDKKNINFNLIKRLVIS